MPDILIRNIDKEKLEKLKAQAKKNNRSLQNELHDMIDAHTKMDLDALRNIVKEAIEEYKATGRTFSDSVEDVRELRDGR